MQLTRRRAVKSSSHGKRTCRIALAVATAITLVPTSARAQTSFPCPASDNRTACENRQGSADDSHWELLAAANLDTTRPYAHVLEGYASKTSVNYKNDVIDLYIKSPGTYDLEVFRMGWYAGRGARRVYQRLQIAAQPQPSCIPASDSTGLIECHWFPISPSLNPGSFLSYFSDGPVSGYYVAKLSYPSRDAPQSQAYIIFVVREDDLARTFLMNSAVSTYQAYNDWGGHSLYSAGTTQVSFDRPYFKNQGLGHFVDLTVQYPGDEGVFPGTGFEYLMVRFLERGPPQANATDIELHTNQNLLTAPNRKAFLSVGHDEYWSKPMHDNLRLARNAGKHIAFFSGNSMFWITNVLPIADDPIRRANRIIETHKDGYPQTPWLWQNCAQPAGPYNAPRCLDTFEESEQTLVGSISTDGLYDRGDFVFNTGDTNHWIVSGSGLVNGSRLPGIIGYEAQTVCGTDLVKFPDCYITQQRRAVPPFQTVLAHSRFKARPHDDLNPPEYLWADMSVYQTNNAWVFSSGSPDWNFGLDVYNDNFVRTFFFRVHPAIGHMTQNILAQLGNLPFPNALGGPAYTLTVAELANPRRYLLSWTNPDRHLGVITDFATLHDVSQNDDVVVDYGHCPVDPQSTFGSCEVSPPPSGHTYAAEYVTLDFTWDSNYTHTVVQGQPPVPDRLRTIWRAVKSTPFTIPANQ